ncbi:MAG TPA: cytochrome c maturation protein CcmE [Gemmatimonadaceae bacterium]
MKPRTKFIIGGALVLGVAGYLMASSISQTGVYYLTPSELSAKMKADSSFANAGVKVGARVVGGSIRRDPGGRLYDFNVTDGSHTFPVRYEGIAPDTFTDSVDVVISGRMGTDGTFRATELLAKCASRYENAPENPANKYKQTQGYKAATGRA